MYDNNSKKEFLKEVMNNEIVKSTFAKKSLKDFLSDITSYKQYVAASYECMMYGFDFKKLHKFMKKNDCRWAIWVDDNCVPHKDEVPSIFAIRTKLWELLGEMEDWINDNGEAKYYTKYYYDAGCGFEIEMGVVDSDYHIDDFEHRVKLTIKFVIDEYSNMF